MSKFWLSSIPSTLAEWKKFHHTFWHRLRCCRRHRFLASICKFFLSLLNYSLIPLEFPKVRILLVKECSTSFRIHKNSNKSAWHVTFFGNMMERDEQATTFTCMKSLHSKSVENFLFLSFMYGSYVICSLAENDYVVLFHVWFLCFLFSLLFHHRFSRISNTIEHKHIFISVLPRTDIFCVLFWKVKKRFLWKKSYRVDWKVHISEITED